MQLALAKVPRLTARVPQWAIGLPALLRACCS